MRHGLRTMMWAGALFDLSSPYHNRVEMSSIMREPCQEKSDQRHRCGRMSELLTSSTSGMGALNWSMIWRLLCSSPELARR
jgi:hypothetical protein